MGKQIEACVSKKRPAKAPVAARRTAADAGPPELTKLLRIPASKTTPAAPRTKQRAKKAAQRTKSTRAAPRTKQRAKKAERAATPEPTTPSPAVILNGHTPHRSGPCRRVWEIAASMRDAPPKEVFAACARAGLNANTTRIQYNAWHRAEFNGQTPAQRFGSTRKPPPPRKRRREGNGTPLPTTDDSAVRVITGTPYADGWRSKRLYGNEVIVAPDGTEYVMAKNGERAHLIVDHTARGLGRVRLRILEDSPRMKRAAKRARQDKEREAEQQREKRTRKRAPQQDADADDDAPDADADDADDAAATTHVSAHDEWFDE